MTSAETAPSRPDIETPSAPVFECPAGRWWACALLGVVFIAMGVFILFNLVAASVVSAIFFAAAVAVAGGFQVVHAFSARGWGSLALSLVIGVLLVALGFFLMLNPLATSIGLTLGISAILVATGVMRLVLAYRHWSDYGWLLLASGLIAVATGVVIFIGFPWSGLVVPGLLLGIDLIFQGAWWLVLGAFVRRPRDDAAQTAPPEALAAS